MKNQKPLFSLKHVCSVTTQVLILWQDSNFDSFDFETVLFILKGFTLKDKTYL